ncbi:uncharacterized protein EV422DRAFT_294683 [Fimicolochytrium jonesii]|uniref:uncharacterized protein n=1 Tax=Fimicolochytrium jonesii TaxID=1396493 RepID=UPI0022FEC453|nr:uncharacterized protein EV422DRAFT_294683 [Fimicolochytrium jonesii]KAI8816285.1 hypothetical protein EV422DRAFT_294683 [Fimicolochytrium jonesii]
MDNSTITECIAHPTVQQAVLDRFLGNATAHPAIQAAIARDAGVQTAVLDSPNVKARMAATVGHFADYASLQYGGPGVMFGISLVFAVTALSISIWRLLSKGNIRAYMLFATTLLTGVCALPRKGKAVLSVLDCGTGIWGKNVVALWHVPGGHSNPDKGLHATQYFLAGFVQQSASAKLCPGAPGGIRQAPGHRPSDKERAACGGGRV